jgi:hypothetical protein
MTGGREQLDIAMFLCSMYDSQDVAASLGMTIVELYKNVDSACFLCQLSESRNELLLSRLSVPLRVLLVNSLQCWRNVCC